MRFLWGMITAAALSSVFSSFADAAPGAAASVTASRSAPEWIAGRGTSHAYSALRAAPPAFVARYGGTWWERRGGPTGDFRRVFGEGVALDPAAELDPAVAISAVERFFDDNSDMLPVGVSAADLALRGTIGWSGRRIVTFSQEVDGVPIEGAVAYAVIVRGRLVLWGMRLYPVAPVETRASIAAKDAERTALEALSGLQGTAEIASAARHILLPLVGDDALELRPAFSIRLSITGLGSWTAFVDARSSALIDLRDERRTMSGQIQLEHHDRNPAGALIAGAGGYLDLTANGEDVTTDLDGAFTAAGTTANVTGNLTGPYVEVQNMAGDDLALGVTGMTDGSSYLWISDASEIEQAQLDVYAFALAVSNHARSLQDDVDWLDDPLIVRPNQFDMTGDDTQDFCNAWSDGSTINFLMAGDGGGYECNNMAMISDVVYHEYGHSLHMANATIGIGVYDYAVGEAFADTMSVSMTHDHIIGPYFYVSGGGIRDVEPDKVWPDDFITPPPEDPYANAHTNGLILGGALWDLRTAFVEAMGETDGHLLTDQIFVGMLRITEDIPSSYEAALAADDDNGDLADSTPNFCTIYDVFELHGLADGGIGRIAIEHAPIAFEPVPDLPIAVDADVYVLHEECSTLGAVRLAYSIDDGASWTALDMEATGGDSYTAELPAMPEGTELRYRIEAEDLDTGNWATRPDNAAEPYYVVYVGPLAEILCDGLEGEDDGGWTHELLEGEDVEGADDWQRGTPGGKGGDPEGAYAGANAWGNDLGILENWNGKYQDGKRNTLRSPTWDLSAYETVRLVFRRWLNVEDGYLDWARIYVNEQEVWANFVSPGSATDPHDTNHTDKEWIQVDLDISELAGGQPEVQVRFELRSNGGYYTTSQFGGWTIDDVCLYTADDAYTGNPDAGDDAGDPDGDAGPYPVSALAMGGCGCDAAGARPAGGSLLSAILASI